MGKYNSMQENKDKILKYNTIRDRWDKEDTLLISRTGIFLTVNSILCAAIGFQKFAVNPSWEFAFFVSIIGLILSILWSTTSWHSKKIIEKMYDLCKGNMPYKLNKIYDIKPSLFYPTTVFSRVLPLLITFSWFIFVTWIILSHPDCQKYFK